MPLTDFIDVFHGWIEATDGVYHDVADYSHMHAGPGIVLVANNANVSMDETGDRRGLLFTQKSPLQGSNAEVLRSALRAALENCRKLENDPALKGELRFSGREIAIVVNDRLLATNTDAAFAEVKPEIDSLGHDLFGGAPFTVERDRDPRKRLHLALKSAQTFGTRTSSATYSILTRLLHERGRARKFRLEKSMNSGKVYIVGAGPGDPGLMTVRGLELLRAANVVVYDQLVNPRLLDEASADAQQIFVGKSAGRHSIAQNEINEVLINYALQGCEVVRLKGGDPFVFGLWRRGSGSPRDRWYCVRNRSRRELGARRTGLRRDSTDPS